MVSQKTIKEYDFKNINEYFNYIIESETNGQNKQVKSLINELSKQQKKDALNYINDNYFNNEDSNKVKNLIFKTL
jgi:hypothetical protein